MPHPATAEAMISGRRDQSTYWETHYPGILERLKTSVVELHPVETECLVADVPTEESHKVGENSGR